MVFGHRCGSWAASVVGLLLVSGVTGCLESSTSGPGEEVAAVIVEPSQATIDVDGTVQLTGTVFTSSGSVLQSEIVWTTSDVVVAEVDEDGLVRGASPGTATVFAFSEGRTGSSEITVLDPGPQVPDRRADPTKE